MVSSIQLHFFNNIQLMRVPLVLQALQSISATGRARLCFQEACLYTSPMKVFTRLRIISREIPKRTIIPLFIGFVALAIIVSMTFLLNQRAQQNFNNVTAESSLRTAATDLRNSMQTAESSQRGYLYTGNAVSYTHL